MIIVYTTGVFDLLHPGHLNILRRARSLGDKLIVGVQEDTSVEAQKGRRPIMSCEERMAMLRELPFVDVVVPYENVDQREMLSHVKPNILVQGGDWNKTANRSKIIDFCKRKGIRVVLFPYTKSVTTTALKERVYASLHEAKREKQMEFDISGIFSLVPIEKLLRYENYDPVRLKKLVAGIKKAGIFFNPLTVGTFGKDGKDVVVDGANRLEALRLLGARYVPVQTVDYLNPNEVQVRGNEHYLHMSPKKFNTLLAKDKVKLDTYTHEANSADATKQPLCLVYFPNGKIGALRASGDLHADVEALNQLVGSYKGQSDIKRRSEVGNLVDGVSILIKFKSFSPTDIVEIALRGRLLESGITWHTPQNTIIRLKVPLNVLTKGFKNARAAATHARQMIQDKLKKQAVRRYMSNVYVYDEWET